MRSHAVAAASLERFRGPRHILGRAETVDQELHLDPAQRRLDQSIAHALAGRVRVEHVHQHPDRLLRPGDQGEDRAQPSFAGRDDLQPIAGDLGPDRGRGSGRRLVGDIGHHAVVADFQRRVTETLRSPGYASLAP